MFAYGTTGYSRLALILAHAQLIYEDALPLLFNLYLYNIGHKLFSELLSHTPHLADKAIGVGL